MADRLTAEREAEIRQRNTDTRNAVTFRRGTDTRKDFADLLRELDAVRAERDGLREAIHLGTGYDDPDEARGAMLGMREAIAVLESQRDTTRADARLAVAEIMAGRHLRHFNHVTLVLDGLTVEESNAAQERHHQDIIEAIRKMNAAESNTDSRDLIGRYGEDR